MKNSIIAGLTLCVAMGAGHAHAFAKKPIRPAHRYAAVRTEIGRHAEPSSPFWVPAHPLIHDCVHVQFPQCSRGGLNDGSFR